MLVAAFVVALSWIATSGGGVAVASAQVAAGSATMTPPGATCDSVALNGPFTDTGGHITSVSFNGCVASGLSFTVTARDMPWTVDFLGAPDPAGWVPIAIHVSFTIDGFACTATVSGAVTGQYNTITHELRLDGGGSLAAEDDANCLGLINPGDHVSLELDVIVT